MPGLSIVIPFWNAEDTIGRAIASALAQDAPGPEGAPRPEVIAIDDGSADSGLAVARGFAGARVETGPNGGAPRARNLGLALVRGDWVTFLDADDRFEGPILANALRRGEETGADIVLSPMSLGGVLHDVLAGDPSPEAVFDGWLAGRWVCTGAVLWRRSFVARIGGWDEALKVHQDGDILLRGLLAGGRLARNTQGCAVYDASNPHSISRSLNAAKLEALLASLALIEARIAGTAFAARTDGLDRAIYGAARRAFVSGHPEIGRRALSRLRLRGVRGHFGSRMHVAAATLLGLERKVRLLGG